MNIFEETRFIMKKYGITANKKLGQNFLTDENVIDTIAKASEITKSDLVIEIGPGLGALTQELLNVSNKVVAIEIDKNMVEVLKENLKCEKLEIINQDFLKVDLNEILSRYSEFKEVVVISNLPYYITSDILEKIIELRNPKITKIVAMMQKEVGKKFVKKEGNIESYLKVLIDNYCTTSIVMYVGKNDFEPRPNVDSIVLKFELNKDKYLLDEDFFFLLKECFKNKRRSKCNKKTWS